MAQSLSNCLVHLIFSTKARSPFLTDAADRAAMHRYLSAVSRQLDYPTIRVGGVADHVHCLARQSLPITVAEWVKELKRASSKWAKSQGTALHGFQWQAGYAAFSVSQSQSAKVEEYIERQEEHHRRFDFQSEIRKLFNAHGVGYDERYIWD
jgi:putative transposase